MTGFGIAYRPGRDPSYAEAKLRRIAANAGRDRFEMRNKPMSEARWVKGRMGMRFSSVVHDQAHECHRVRARYT